MCYLKIINTFEKQYMHIKVNWLSKELKNDIEIVLGPVVFKL